MRKRGERGKGRKERERRKNTQKGRDIRREKGRGIGRREIMLFLDSLTFHLGGVNVPRAHICRYQLLFEWSYEEAFIEADTLLLFSLLSLFEMVISGAE